MSYKIKQLDLEDRQLLTPQGEKVWTDIGHAEIEHTIFGKAKVRIVRKHDNLRRTLWRTSFILIVLALLIWQSGILDLFKTEPAQSVETPDNHIPRIEVVAPVPLIDYASHPRAAQAMNAKPATPALAGHKLVMQGQSGVPQSSSSPKAASPAYPLAQHPSAAINAHSAPLAAGVAASGVQAATPQPRRVYPPRQLAASGVAVVPTATVAASGVVAVPRAPAVVKASDVKLAVPVEKPVVTPDTAPAK